MDIQAITDLLLQSGQELAKKGQDLAAEKLQLLRVVGCLP